MNYLRQNVYTIKHMLNIYQYYIYVYIAYTILLFLETL